MSCLFSKGWVVVFLVAYLAESDFDDILVDEGNELSRETDFSDTFFIAVRHS